VQDRFALGSGHAGGDVDQVTAQGRPARSAVAGAGQGRGRAQQLCAMPAQIAQAELAPKRPEGMWARGPSMRSAKVVSMIAWRRWVISAAVAGSVELVKNG